MTTVLELVDQIHRDGILIDHVLEWLREVATREAPPMFKPKDSCGCPVAVYLRERYKADTIFAAGYREGNDPVSIEVGDDDISVEGYHALEMPSQVAAFVRWFDANFDDCEHVRAPKLLERWISVGGPHGY